jgi:similar to phospho-adenylylsulfate sulfotransferase|nr:MAG TPA: phosphoadenosine-phosphosulfate reductase [Caudoviricetes sp.]
MWSDFGFNIPISEGRFWLDNGIIKGFTHDGELHKLYKYKVYDDLTISITEHKDFKNTIKSSFREDVFETWEETYQRLKLDLQVKIDECLDVIKQTVKDYSDYEKIVLTSTGKDSMVVLDLVQKIIPDIQVMFNNTSLDCADTYRMVKLHKNWIVNNPPEGFYTWIKKYNFIPQRMARSCCSVFKEGNGDNYFEKNKIIRLLSFMGIRNDESNARADREYIMHSPKWGNKDWYGCLPIRKWLDLDVWLYILHFNIEINCKYKKGYSRCGCAIACPFATKNTWILDKYWYPKMRERWEKILTESFYKNNRWVRMNCTKNEYLMCWNGGLLRPEPTEEVIREMMEYKGITNYNVAKQYFNKTCSECGKNVRQNDVLAMNMKYHGRNVTEFKCKKCLMNELNMSKEEWDKKVEDFKNQGCSLF